MINEVKMMSPDDIREFCIMHNMYTCGTNKDYTRLLSYVKNNQYCITTEVLYTIASDIYWHSDNFCTDLDSAKDDILDLMGSITRDVVHTMYIYVDENNYEGEVCNDR